MKSVVEAILLVSPEPVDPAALAKVYPEFPKGDVEKALAELEAEYAAEGRGLRIKMVAEGYRLETRPEFDPWLDRFFEVEHEAKLSLAALETLAIVAYRQPMTLPEINDIRGVNSAGVLRTLLERKLVKIHGRKPVVGSPFMYRTTRQFLEHFGLASLADLPKPEEMEQLLGEGVKLPGEIGQLSLPEDLPEGEEGESSGENVAPESETAGEEHPEPAAEEPASPPAESSEETADPAAGEEGAGD